MGLSAKTALQAEYEIEAVCENETCIRADPKVDERDRVSESQTVHLLFY